MKRAESLSLLRHQRDRGPLPAGESAIPSAISFWIAGLSHSLPLVECPVAEESVRPLRASGIAVLERGGDFFARLPADGDVVDRLLALSGAPPILGGAASLLLAALEKNDDRESPPVFSLPLRMRPAKASSLGWSPELFSLTVLVSNARVRKSDGAILSAGEGPVVAVCAEYQRPLTSLDPPSVAEYPVERAREQGMPTLRLQGGWLSGPLRLEATSKESRAPSGRGAALARASLFLAELDEAWQRRSVPALQIAWPVYRSERSGVLLDAVVGRPLPEIDLA